MSQTQTFPITFIIFGASGDLANRKLIPAIFNLTCKGRLPEQFQIVGFAIEQWSDQEFKANLRKGVDEFATFTFSDTEWDNFASHLTYFSGNFTEPADYQKLETKLGEIEKGLSGRIYYMATPPTFFARIPEQLSKAGMLEQKGVWRRLVVEKPFGSSYETAHALNIELHKYLSEEQIFRIDHYLGKETVQNLLVFRFANTMFEPVWSQQYIDNVQISVLEEVGVGHRGGYYDRAGILRDMFQNHLLQLLTIVTIEQPDSLMHEDLHARKMEVLESIRPMTAEDIKKNTVRGQYLGYLDADNVAPGSTTPTYAALKLFVDNGCWEGVPFYLRSGKSLGSKCTEIIIHFDCPPGAVYPMPPKEDITPNILAFCIQPDEGIFLRFEAKVPDTEADMRSVEMVFHYKGSFGTAEIPEAYETLLLEVIQGDQTLFVQDDITEAAWKIIDPILKAWSEPDAPPLETYAQGSFGPDAASQLINQDGREWFLTCGDQGKG